MDNEKRNFSLKNVITCVKSDSNNGGQKMESLILLLTGGDVDVEEGEEERSLMKKKEDAFMVVCGWGCCETISFCAKFIKIRKILLQ